MKIKQSKEQWLYCEMIKSFSRSVLNVQSGPPMMFADEIDELESFEDVNLPRTGFSFFPEEGNETVEAWKSEARGRTKPCS